MRTLVCFALGLLLPAAAAAQPAGPEVYGPDEKVAGKTPGEWSAEWWKWALAAPKDRNPITDTTGAHAAAGQPAGVWFLAGTFGEKASRKCTVPAGRPVLVAVFNYVASEPSKERSPAERAAFEKKMAAEAKEQADRVEVMSVVVDGRPVADLKKHRAASPLFETVAPPVAEAVHPSFAGKQTGVSDGYWVMLKPLSPGEHTVRITSSQKARPGDPPFALDVTYTLTVAAAKK